MPTAIRSRTLIAAALLTASLGMPSPATAGQAFETVWAFGDSLTDDGNLFALTEELIGFGIPPAPYFEGRSTNGLVWVEHLASPTHLDANLMNFAYAGATTGGFGVLPGGTGAQVLLGTGVLSPLQVLGVPTGAIGANDLVVLWAGANDIVFGLNTPDGTTHNLVKAVNALSSRGGETFLLMNLPDLGRTPDGAASGFAELLSAASVGHNSLLSLRMAELRAELGADIVVADVFAAYNEILAHPKLYGFENTTESCLDNLTTGVCNPDTWLSWDGFHPTAAGHELIAEFAAATLNAAATGAGGTPALVAIGRRASVAQTAAIAHRLSAERMGDSGFGLLGSGFAGSSSLERRLAMAEGGNQDAVGSEGVWLPLSGTATLRAAAPRLSVFLYRDTHESRQLGTLDVAGFDAVTETQSLGLDYRLNDRLLVGMVYARSDSSASIATGGSTEAGHDGFALYTAYDADGFRTDLSIGLTRNDYDRITRSTGSRLFPTAAGSAEGTTTYADFETGYSFDLGRATLGPTAGLRWSRGTIDAYTESGAGPLNLSYGGQTTSETVGRLGFGGAAVFATGTGPVATEFGVDWSTSFSGTSSPISASLADGYTRSLDGNTRAGDRLSLNAGAAMGLAPGLTGTVGVQSAFDSAEGAEHQARASLALRF